MNINAATQTDARHVPGVTLRQRRGYLGSGPKDLDTLLGLLQATLTGLDSIKRPLAASIQ